MTYVESGPTGTDRATDNNNSTPNNTRKLDTTQGIIQILHVMTWEDSEGKFEIRLRYPTIDQYTWLQDAVDMTFCGAWLEIDDNVISIWFGSDWDWAVRIASEIAKQNGWAFRCDKIKRRFKFGHAYSKELRSSTSDAPRNGDSQPCAQ